ncbi:Vacuolar protein sorting-associated protein 41, partial [Ascosphaera pollenicola]
VHEKSVLLPLLPTTLLLGTGGGLGRSMRAWIGWINILAAVTLYPLLKRDGLAIPYAIITLLWAYFLGLPPTSLRVYTERQPRLGDDGETKYKYDDGVSLPTCFVHLVAYAGMVVWHVGEATVVPPRDKPDLWAVLNAVMGAAGFGVAYLWSTWRLVRLAWCGGTVVSAASQPLVKGRANANVQNGEGRKKR